MPRRPRIDFAGFHHIVNRGVARTDIYLCSDDKNKFLEILCKACKLYRVNVHDYCLMDNHYHLLLELTEENLSLLMRQINSNYAIYFNKKYKRSGHLWQGRYKSYYVVNESYLFTLYKYIEQNPIQAKLSEHIGQYEFTLLATFLQNSLNIIECARHSQLLELLKEDGVLEHLELNLNDDELQKLKEEQKRKIEIKEHELKLHKLKSIEEHFSAYNGKEERNSAIANAIKDGYTQVSIAKYLDVSTSTISKVLKRFE